MRAAYDALSSVASPRAHFVAAELAVELSGVPRIVLGLAGLSGTPLYLSEGSLTEFAGYLDQFGADAALLVEASLHYRAALAGGWTIEPMDYLYGSTGLLCLAARTAGGGFDFSDSASPSFVSRLPDAIAFLDDGLARMGATPGDTELGLFLGTFRRYLQSL